jgi:hypothetical protein
LKQREQRIIQEYERKKADMLKQQIDDARLWTKEASWRASAR